MEELDIPIFKKSYDLYKAFHGLRSTVPKADRHGLWQRIEQTALDIITSLLLAGQRPKDRKHEPLEHASVRLNLLRMLLRLAKETRVIDAKKYVETQYMVDEIGRMLGGWIKSLRVQNDKAPPPEEFLREERRKCQREATPLFEFGSSFQLLTLRPSGLHLTWTRLP